MCCALFYLVFITGARLGLGGFTSGAPCSERNTAVLHKSNWQMPKEPVECVDITPMRKSTRAPFAPQVVEATTLYADHMRLTRLPLFVFTMMPHLQLLDLSGNKLTRISKDAFLPLCGLHTLLLEGNHVAVPKKTPLLSSPSLKTLMLSNNKIRMLRQQTFSQLQALTVLYLDRNWLVRVHPKVFSPLTHLKYLHLGNNRLKVLPHVVLSAPKAVLIVAGNPLNSTEEYTVRPGTMDMGKEYEIQMAALLSLRCVLSAEEDMWLASNPDGVGALDDIIVNVKRPGGSTLTYMLQMKHKEKPTPITEDEYLSSNIKHHYRLVKYYTDIDSLKTSMGSTSTKKEIIKGLGKFHHIYFLLFTNRPTESCAFLKSVDEKHHVRNLSFVNTSDSTKSNAYIFDTKQLPMTICKDKKIKFYLLTNQVHGNSLNVKINQELVRIANKLGLNNVNCKKVSEKYTKFISKWAKGHLGGHYCLTKKNVISKLVSLLLSQYELNLAGETFQEYTGEGMSTWNEIIRGKSIIIVDSTKLVQHFLIQGIANEVVQYCNKPYKSWTDSFDSKANQWFYKTHNNLKREMFEIVGQFGIITLLDLYKCLWKVERCPLILQIHKEEEYKTIVSILKLSARHPQVVIMNATENFSPKSEAGDDLFSSFQDLGEEQRQKVLDNTVKVEGRDSAKVKDLIDKTMFGYITSRDIIHILSNQYNVCGKPSYGINPDYPGVCLIINQEIFSNDFGKRHGTNVDRDSLRDTFVKFGFTMIIKNDLTHLEIVYEIKEAVSQVTTDSSLIICILSHGDKGIVYGADGVPVYVNDIKRIMSRTNEKNLNGKPKVLILQASQGDRFLEDNYEDEGESMKVTTTADMLILWAAAPGYAALRNKNDGSWFIQSLCQIINQRAADTHFLEIFTLVKRDLSSKVWDGNKAMVPHQEATLTRFFYLPSKLSRSKLVQDTILRLL